MSLSFFIKYSNNYLIIPIVFPFFKKVMFFFLFLAALSLCCCMQAFSSCTEPGLLFIEVVGFLTAMASLVLEHGLSSSGARV